MWLVNVDEKLTPLELSVCSVNLDSSRILKDNVNDVQSTRTRHILEHANAILADQELKSTLIKPNVNLAHQVNSRHRLDLVKIVQ